MRALILNSGVGQRMGANDMFYNTPFCPVDISILSRAQGLNKIEGFLDRSARTLVMIGSGLLSALDMRAWVDRVVGVDGVLFTGITANPTVETVAHALNAIEGKSIDRIIAIGGGSCMDLAKAVSAFHALIPPSEISPQAVRSAIIDKKHLHTSPFIGVIAVPTTAGTGSEVTKWATIWDPEMRSKRSIDYPQLFPQAAVLIPEFTVGISKELTLSTGLDALSHAMEAFWANARDPLAQTLALAAVRQVITALPEVLIHPDSIEKRRDMCVASLTAGLAFSRTRTTACHSISYPLTMLYGISHGFASAVTLLEVMRRNASQVLEIDRLYAEFGGEARARDWFDAVARDIQPLCLSAFGVERARIPEIAELAFTQGRMDNNPVGFTVEDVCDILYKCYE